MKGGFNGKLSSYIIDRGGIQMIFVEGKVVIYMKINGIYIYMCGDKMKYYQVNMIIYPLVN